MVPIHPEDQHLLGIHWDSSIFMDQMLPFGLRSAPMIFSAVADAAQWALMRCGIAHSLHYLDDFILVSTSAASAEHQKHLLVSQFDSLGIPIEPTKLEGPTQCFTFLGIEVDTVSLQTKTPKAEINSTAALPTQVCVSPISEETGPGAPQWAPTVRYQSSSPGETFPQASVCSTGGW